MAEKNEECFADLTVDMPFKKTFREFLILQQVSVQDMRPK